MFIPKIGLNILALFALHNALFAQKITEEYIQKYDSIAIKEMERSGIPASIKLAQGICESNSGASELATEANNHFGIKCTSDWKGDGFHKWDDDPQKSCFRVYGSPEECYNDHTEFLTKRKHYSFLFQYEQTDYKNWAYGLRKAGYATDPNYPTKIIETIEKYKLHRYDTMGVRLIKFQDSLLVLTPLLTDDSDVAVLNSADNLNRKLRTKPRSFLFTSYEKGIFSKNQSSYVIPQQTESMLGLATRFGIPYKKLLKFNDMLEGDQLMLFQYVYIQPKKASYKGEEQFHKVQQDETMYEIAQYYGIRLEALLHRNQLSVGQEPQTGEIVMLKERALARPKLRPSTYTDQLPNAPQDTVAEFRPILGNDADQEVVKTVPRPQPKPLEENKPTYSDQIYNQNINTVTPEDTIRNTAKVTEIPKPKTTNELNNNALFDLKKPKPDTITLPKDTVNGNALFPPKPPTPSPKPQTPSPKPTPVAPKMTTHIVQANETLGKIAQKYNITIQALKTANNLSNDKILLKQVLKIPKSQ